MLWVCVPLFQTEKGLPGSFIFTDRFGVLVTDLPNAYGYFRERKSEISASFLDILVRAEDKNFWHHFGVDMGAKMRALRDGWSAWRMVSGGSTLTEQWIKNAYFPREKRTWLQKMREATLAMGFSMMISKKEMIERYLDTVYFGNNIYGIQAAIEAYFGVTETALLTPEQMVFLCARLRYPWAQTPTEKTFSAYYERLAKRLWIGLLSLRDQHFSRHTDIDMFPFVTRAVQREIAGQEEKQEYQLALTIDAEFMRKIEQSMGCILGNLSARNVTNAAAVVLDSRTGEIRAYIGGKNWQAEQDGQIDMLTRPRSTGSVLKPFLYALALERGADSLSLLPDVEHGYQLDDGTTYYPTNYNLREKGVVTLRQALANSLNIPAVRILEKVGLETYRDFLRSFGFSLPNPGSFYGYGLALGGSEQTPLQVATAWGKLFGNTSSLVPHLLQKQDFSSSSSLKNISSANQFLLADMLADPQARAASFGEGGVLDIVTPQVVKTGTSQDFRDNWVASWGPSLTVVVWVGNTDRSSMLGVNGVAGAGPLWNAILSHAQEWNMITPLPKEAPGGLARAKVCQDIACLKEGFVWTKQKQFLQQSFFDEKQFLISDFWIQPSANDRKRLEKMSVKIVDK